MKFVLKHLRTGFYFDYQRLLELRRIEYHFAHPCRPRKDTIELGTVVIDLHMLEEGTLELVGLVHDSFTDCMDCKAQYWYEGGKTPAIQALLTSQEAIWVDIQRNGGIR